MLNALMEGFLIVLILVSLIFLPLQFSFSPTEVLLYCKRTIVVMAWLWIFIAPLLVLCLHLGVRLMNQHKRPDEWHPGSHR